MKYLVIVAAAGVAYALYRRSSNPTVPLDYLDYGAAALAIGVLIKFALEQR
jgi:hypothetical protein